MHDGHLNKCKECIKRCVKINRKSKQSQYAIYEKARNKEEHRKTLRSIYQDRHRLKYPDKYSARVAVGNAVRDGRLSKSHCWCGSSKVEAHHEDYGKPLDVIWLCHRHHRELEGRVA